MSSLTASLYCSVYEWMTNPPDFKDAAKRMQYLFALFNSGLPERIWSLSRCIGREFDVAQWHVLYHVFGSAIDLGSSPCNTRNSLASHSFHSTGRRCSHRTRNLCIACSTLWTRKDGKRRTCPSLATAMRFSPLDQLLQQRRCVYHPCPCQCAGCYRASYRIQWKLRALRT